MSNALFALSAELRPRFEMLGGQVPALIVDDIYQAPDQVREAALRQSFEPPPYPYPGRLAAVPHDESLQALTRTVLALANREFLPRVPPISQDGQPVAEFGRVMTDFATVDIHPDDLLPVQRRPHVDPVPVFGLIYLNPQEKGGTLFFRQTMTPVAGRSGYITAEDPEFELAGRIEGRFNRLAIYAGFVPHSGEIVGDWVRTDERFTNPRLTQRFVFFP